jgi:hypothetical protein
MTPSTSLRRRSGAHRQSGQMIVVFALCLVAIIAMAGLLIDGGNAWATRRQAQAAADTAALAGAVSLANSTTSDIALKRAAAQAAAKDIAVANGFGTTGAVDCSGTPLPNDGVTVNWPPATVGTPHEGDSLFIEVFTTRAMRTAFAGVVGQTCWMVTSRAVAETPGPQAHCSTCALTKYAGSGDENIFIIDNTGHLRSDGDIVANGHHIVTPCTPDPTGFLVCYRGIHVFHTGGSVGNFSSLSAPHISISSGWESGPYTQVQADALPAGGCGFHPNPISYSWTEPVHPGYTSPPYPLPNANVCIGVTPIDDPLNPPTGITIEPPDATTTPIPQPGAGTCPSLAVNPNVRVPTGTVASPAKLVLNQGTPGGPNFTICPGLYPGGFAEGSGFGVPTHVDMIPGVYIMLGGGFQVGGVSSITGNGVMIYNTNANQSFALPTAPWTGTLPLPTCAPCTPLTSAVMTGVASINVETPTDSPYPKYVLTLTAPSAPNPTGTVTFYNGDDILAGCEDVVLTPSGLNKATASCVTTFHEFGRQFITGVYSGDIRYSPISDDMFTDVTPNAILGFGGFSLCTGAVCGASAPCSITNPPAGACVIKLSSPPLGAPFHGMLVFQERFLGTEGGGLGVVIKPALGLPDCVNATPGSLVPSWMTDGVPGGPNPGALPPDPCGPLGGLDGTIYAPHARSDVCPISPPPAGCIHDAAVEFRADGATFLQIIGGRISLQYNNDVRLLFDLSHFAGGGRIRLVE